MNNHRNAAARVSHWAGGLAAAASLLAGAAAAQSLPAPAVPQPAPLAQPSLLPPALPATPLVRPIPSAEWTPERIQQSFNQADSNSNGELTRAEAQSLAILPRSFEEMDENKDGVVTRAEYQRAFPQ